MQRYFAVDEKLNLTSQDKFHISKVMRMKENDLIEVVYDKNVYLCKIQSIKNNDVLIKKEKS